MYHAHWLAIQLARDVIDANNRPVVLNGSAVSTIAAYLQNHHRRSIHSGLFAAILPIRWAGTVEDNGSTIAHANRGINIAVMKFRFDCCILTGRLWR